MKNKIDLGEREIEYELIRKPVNNLNLRIRSDCSVCVSANNNVESKQIDDFLYAKKGVIVDALYRYSEIAKYSEANHEYLAGESFRYLGRDLRLKVLEGKKSVTTDGVYLFLSLPNKNNLREKERLIDKWFDAECRRLFPELIEKAHVIFQKYDVALPKLILRDMETRWGSCQSKRNTITLNKRLIETPLECIEYVIVHEFTHFLLSNHSREFYDLLNVFMPDWKARKSTLEKYMYQKL